MDPYFIQMSNFILQSAVQYLLTTAPHCDIIFLTNITELLILPS